MLNTLNMLYTNSDILTNKLNELHLLAVEHHLDIIMITEVKAKYSFEPITPQHIKLEGFDIYSNFEDNESKRGIAIYISHRIYDKVTELKVNTDFHECLWLNLSLRGRDKL